MQKAGMVLKKKMQLKCVECVKIFLGGHRSVKKKLLLLK